MSTRAGVPVSLQFKVELNGPFFAPDSGKTVRKNIHEMMVALAGLGEAEVKRQIDALRGSMKYATGYSAAHTKGELRSMTGRPWYFWISIGLPTTGMDRREAIRTKAAGASIERRFHPFRKTKNTIVRSRAILAANLSKGLE